MAGRRFAAAAAAAFASSSRRAAPTAAAAALTRARLPFAAAAFASSSRRAAPTAAAAALTRARPPFAAASYRLTWSRPLAYQAGPSGFWSYSLWRDSLRIFLKNAKDADDADKVIYAAHALVWIVGTGIPVVAVWYVDGCVNQEATKREEFQRQAVKGHLEFVQKSLDSQMKVQNKIDGLNDKLDSMRHQILSDKEEGVQYRHQVTDSVEELRKKGYLVLSAVDFEKLLAGVRELKVQVTDLKTETSKTAQDNDEMTEVKKTECEVPKEQASQPLKVNNEKEQEPGEGGISNLLVNTAQDNDEITEVEKAGCEVPKNQSDSGKQQVPGDEGICNRAQPAPSAPTAVKVNDKENDEVHTTEGQKTGSIDKIGAEGENTGSSDKTAPF